LFKDVFTDTAPTSKHEVPEIPHFIYAAATILKQLNNWPIASEYSELI
jgi:hypothetical protein